MRKSSLKEEITLVLLSRLSKNNYVYNMQEEPCITIKTGVKLDSILLCCAW